MLENDILFLSYSSSIPPTSALDAPSCVNHSASASHATRTFCVMTLKRVKVHRGGGEIVMKAYDLNTISQ
jgi:hypothetical protein